MVLFILFVQRSGSKLKKMTQTPNGTPTGSRYFSFLLKNQTGPGAHPASYSVGVEGSSLEVKLQGYEDDQSPPNSVEVKNEWRYTATPPTSLHCVDMGNFTFLFLTLPSTAVFLNRRAAARYRDLASIIAGRERFFWS